MRLYKDFFFFESGDVIKVKPSNGSASKHPISSKNWPWILDAKVIDYKHPNYIKVKYINGVDKGGEIDTQGNYIITQGHILLSKNEKRNILLNRLIND